VAEQKITDEQWAKARKRYETEPGLGFGKVAQVLDCSKNLVARKAREGKWQKDFGVPNQVHPTAREREAKVTESAVPSPTQAVHVNGAEASTRPAHVVAEVFVPPTGSQGMKTDVTPGVGSVHTPSQSNGYADEMQMPADLDEVEREEYIKRAIVSRQRSINARHLKELNAARSKLYESLKAAGSKEGPGAALASQRNITALLALQAGELDTELQRVRLEVAEFVGKPMKPTPCRIVVHLLPGMRMTGSEVYGRNATEVTDVVAQVARNA
jgi:flagellar biosynthesis/type III secretory pathway protein FliH